ncbi:MAG TPA: ribbon-helix-helix domain-containing protein [Nevskiales bacterium]|jgi:Arc/MetJ-type ribon-helix-helix transcriptional regulator|nr:ribbon-helix-helix domain-containing protein [Nevskiales bacterium]
MRTAKIAITIDDAQLRRIDQLVRARKFANRSRAIQEAVREKLERMERGRLAQECAKLQPAEEQALADEGLAKDLAEWPES